MIAHGSKCLTGSQLLLFHHPFSHSPLRAPTHHDSSGQATRLEWVSCFARQQARSIPSCAESTGVPNAMSSVFREACPNLSGETRHTTRRDWTRSPLNFLRAPSCAYHQTRRSTCGLYCRPVPLARLHGTNSGTPSADGSAESVFLFACSGSPS